MVDKDIKEKAKEAIEEKKEEGSSISVKAIVGVVMVLLSFFGFAMYFQNQKDKEKLVAAQNKIAEMSVVIKEKEETWSRLSLQDKNIIKVLESKNENLSNLIKERDEKISTLSETVIKFKTKKIIIEKEKIVQVELPMGRKRVDFTHEEDPYIIKGHTLTDPPETELEIGYTRPFKLTTILTQLRDGSWKTYVETNWPNIDVNNIETYIDPQPIPVEGRLSKIMIGGGLMTNIIPKIDSVLWNVDLLYDFGKVATGPSFGLGGWDGKARTMFGWRFMWKPWGKK